MKAKVYDDSGVKSRRERVKNKHRCSNFIHSYNIEKHPSTGFSKIFNTMVAKRQLSRDILDRKQLPILSIFQNSKIIFQGQEKGLDKQQNNPVMVLPVDIPKRLTNNGWKLVRHNYIQLDA